ncbi:energy transducer TonB [Ferruginibacter sp.]|uniref:energy transducer TonB n=1 Tax=Ferruginibacter sp. TaxID=1940288 RepID=UPI00265AE3C1|nr:energy transducer TonB [Ferruginibacter sp.]
MKKYLLFFTIILFATISNCHAQYVYYFDDQLAITKASKAVVIGKGGKEDDGLFRLDYFLKKGGSLLMSAHYTDSSLSKMQGEFSKFYADGSIQEQGTYLNDEQSGLWEKWDSAGRKSDSSIFQTGKAVTKSVFNYYKNGQMSYYSYEDSLTDILKRMSYNEKGELKTEVYFKGQNGILKSYDSGRVMIDSLFTREEKEAQFSGGEILWRRYLEQTLNASTPVNNGARNGIYQVIVRFIVAKDGSISNVTSETKHGYGMEQEVIRIIQNGPAWEPAIQYGRKVNAYRRQPVTFVVQ